MGTTTNHALEYPDAGDNISAYPTTAKATAEKVDDALVPKGGSAGQILQKVSDDDYSMTWADENSGPDGEAYPGISNDVPNDLQEKADGLYVPPGWLNSEDADDVAYAAAATVPVQLFGPGRPDSAGLNLTAPQGSSFTCTDSNGGNNFGARKWSKGPSGWYVTDGYIQKTLNPVTTTLDGFTRGNLHKSGDLTIFRWAQEIYLSATFGVNAYSGNGTDVDNNGFLWEAVGGSEAQRWLGGNGATTQSILQRDYKTMVQVSPFYARVYGITTLQADDSLNFFMTITVRDGVGWPTSDVGLTRTVDALRELIEAIEAEGEPYPPNYAALKAELEALHNQTGTGDIQ